MLYVYPVIIVFNRVSDCISSVNRLSLNVWLPYGGLKKLDETALEFINTILP